MYINKNIEFIGINSIKDTLQTHGKLAYHVNSSSFLLTTIPKKYIAFSQT